MDIVKLDKSEVIGLDEFVDVTRMSNGTFEISYLANKSDGLVGMVKKSKYYCMDKTGKVIDYQLSENRAQSIESLGRTRNKLRLLINNNFYGDPNELSITLTYGMTQLLLNREWITKKQERKAHLAFLLHGEEEKKTMADYCLEKKYVTQEQLDVIVAEVRDVKVFSYKFKKFIARFMYRYRAYGGIEYICVKEPQGITNHNAWHAHVLISFSDVCDAPVIDNETELQPLWGLGFTTCNPTKDSNLTASYLSTFKEDRLHLYPSGTNMYSKSGMMIYPRTQRMKYKLALEKVKDKECAYSETVIIADEVTGQCVNSHTVEQYQDIRSGL